MALKVISSSCTLVVNNNKNSCICDTKICCVCVWSPVALGGVFLCFHTTNYTSCKSLKVKMDCPTQRRQEAKESGGHNNNKKKEFFSLLKELLAFLLRIVGRSRNEQALQGSGLSA